MCKIYVGETFIERSMYAKNDQEITKIICIFFRKVKHELRVENIEFHDLQKVLFSMLSEC